jgi:Transposase IS66 family
MAKATIVLASAALESNLAHLTLRAQEFGKARPGPEQSDYLAGKQTIVTHRGAPKEIPQRQSLDRSTLAGWVGAASELVAPLVDEISKHVLAASKVHADDTPVPVLAPGNGKTKTGRLWAYVRDDRPSAQTTAPAVWFAYSEDRKGEHPRQHLKNFSGALQADAYSERPAATV